MSNNDIESRIMEFDLLAQNTQKHLADCIAQLNEHRVPSDEDIQLLDKNFVVLRRNYDEIVLFAKNQITAEELPEDGSGIDLYADAIKNSKAEKVRKAIKRVSSILERFIKIRSELNEYAAALAPYQSEATVLLDHLNEDTVADYELKASAPELFLSAVDKKDLTDSDGFKLLEQLSQHYSTQVQWGLVGHRYYLDSQDETLMNSIKEPLTDSASEETESVEFSELSKSEIEENNAAETEESSKEESVENEVEQISLHEETLAEDKNNSEDSAESEKTESNKTISPINKLRSVNPSVESFVKEVQKIETAFEEVSYIVPFLTHSGAATVEMMYLFGVYRGFIDESDKAWVSIEKCLDKMTDKGLVACYECEVDGVMEKIYCLSEYCYNALRKDKVRKYNLWRIKLGKSKFAGMKSMKCNELLEIVRKHKLLFQYLDYARSTLSSDDFEAVINSSGFSSSTPFNLITVIDHGIMTECIQPTDISECDCLEDAEDTVSVLICNEIYPPESINPCVATLYVCTGSEIKKYSYKGGILQNEEQSEETLSTDATETVAEKTQLKSDEAVIPEKNNQVVEELCEKEEAKKSLLLHKMLNSKDAPSDEEICGFIYEHLNQPVSTKEQLKSAVTETVLFADSAALIKNRPNTSSLAAKLRFATHLMTEDQPYTSENLTSVFTDPENDDPALTLGAYLFAMLTPAVSFDYGLKEHTDSLFYDFEYYFENFNAFKPLFNKLLSLQNVGTNGFSPAVISLLGGESERKSFVNNLKVEASNNLTVKPPKTKMKGLPALYANWIGKGSDIYECVKIIAEGHEDTNSVEFIEAVLEEYCDRQDETYSLNMEKLEEKLDEHWSAVVENSKFKLEFFAHDQIIKQLVSRLQLMLTWSEQMKNINKEQDISRLRVLRQELIALCAEIKKDESWKNCNCSNILAWLLEFIPTYLNGKYSSLNTYSDLLLTGYIAVSEDGAPDIDPAMTEIRYFEPWRSALLHINAEKKTVGKVKDEILGGLTASGNESWMKDNLHQLKMLGELIGSKDEDFIVTESQIKEAVETADERSKHFEETLELAYTYNQINEIEKETLLGIVTKYKQSFYNSMEFANWHRFLEALESQIKEYAENRKAVLSAKLDLKLTDNSDSDLLLEAKRLLDDDMNLAVAEEFINRFESGETELEDGSALIVHEKDYYSDFLNKTNYETLLQVCKSNNGRALRSFGWAYAEKNLPADWTSRLRDDCKSMISNWPPRNNYATPEHIKTLFKCLGFDVTQVRKVSGYKDDLFKVEVEPVPNSMSDYRHPISAFGTRLKSPLNVIILFGNYTEKQLVDTITNYNLGGIAIVLIDRPIDAGSRRLIGEIFHTQTSGQNPFLLIDQVLFLYLAMHQVTERIPAMLKCTLPYTTYQPFIRDGGSTSDEMFCGRTQELDTIIHESSVVVYGGRQLGKTALLERAESRCSKPENKEYAVYVSIVRIAKEEDVVNSIIAAIDKKSFGKIKLTECSTIKQMCNQIDSHLRNGIINSLHLFIDEVDVFMEAIKNTNYTPLQPFVDLSRESKGRFKFVIAGLHNVARAKNATEENGNFGQIGTPLCIKPLAPTDALKLLSRPLSYLGFQIDRYPHLETILTNTNYYPGILQFFGYMLVQTLNAQYSRYYRAADGNPPFTLQDDQLGSVMSSSDINKSIKDKFRLSLELDPRYFMIARCITMLYHFHEEDRTAGSWLGFTIDEIMEMAESYDIHCLKNENYTSYGNLLDEMVDMGILSQPETGLYRLRRNSFVDIIGDNMEKLEKEIQVKNEESLHG